MGKFRGKTFGVTIIAILTVVFALLIGVNGDGALGANLELPTLNITEDQFGNKIITNLETQEKLLIVEEFNIPNIACWVAQNVVVRDEAGGFIGVSKSPFFKSNPFVATPTFSVIDTETGKSVVGGTYTTNAQIKCSTGKILVDQFGTVAPVGEIDPEEAFEILFPSFEVPLTVEDSFFTIRVYVQLPNNTWKEVFNVPYKIDRFDINSAEHVLLPPFTIKQVWLQKFLPDGDYQATLKFVYEGAVVMHWKQTGLCSQQCANIDFVIPFITERTFEEGKKDATNVHNEFEVNRLITFGVVGNGEGETVECDGITESVDPDTGICVAISPSDQPCKQGQFKSGGVCVNIGGANGDPSSKNSLVPEVFGKLSTCVASGDLTCLASADFLPFWIFGVGLIVVVGALAQSRQPEIYGVPRSGF